MPLPTEHSVHRNSSVSSFDQQFDDSLDAALANLESNPFTDNQSTLSQLSDADNVPLQDMSPNQQRKDSFDMALNDDVPLIGSTATFGATTHTGSIWSRTLSALKIKHGVSLSRKNSTVHLTDKHVERTVYPGVPASKFSTNAISNAKYNPITFIPLILYEQFKFFFNLYFLLVALSQAIPALRIGYLSSYVVPLAFVLVVTMSKEAMDDIQRRRRDMEANNELYEVIGRTNLIPSKSLEVGDLVKVHKDTRIPADMILLQSSESTGESFIKTDQLDGETDWKLRIACPLTQNLSLEELNHTMITASAPEKSIHSFLGRLNCDGQQTGLTIDNAMWANTVLASGTAIGCVIYTGSDTRQAMNTTMSGAKTGLLELEINRISKILCICVFVLSFSLVAVNGFGSAWYLDVMRFLILFSTIIPVSLRVNLDLAKSVYAYQIEHDESIKDSIVRTSTIPEDLGRIEYLLSDKTGTLTQNDMELKKLHLGTVSYAGDTMDIVSDYVSCMTSSKPVSNKRDMGNRVRDLVTTLAICHNVTPTIEDGVITYQAASPDEIAIVKFTEQVGLSLFRRDRHNMTLVHAKTAENLHYEILQTFPFNSDTKRMGIIVRDTRKKEYWFLQKGADTVMSNIVQSNDWLDEETSNMAREGLRTLVIGRKSLSEKLYESFREKYEEASASMLNRDAEMQKIISHYLESDLELLGLTGVEDKLQKDVKSSIELLRNAGIKIWMLTGDKVETARCVSVSAKLISRGQYVHTITRMIRPERAMDALEYLRVNKNSCLLIDGESLGLYLRHYRQEFFNIVVHLPCVIACRCTPQQKADVAVFIREITKKRVCCIGDGGNDVSMIRCADIGVGIVGKEGKQASLAADFSITQFCHLTTLLLWHGRNSYKRSAKLGQFVIHRGLLISVAQAIFSVTSSYEPIALITGFLMVGYATCYTMMPVFALVFDHDVEKEVCFVFPELYHELTSGKSLSYATFFVWVAVSLYQGSVIQLFSQTFTSIQTEDFTKMVALCFTGLVLNELVMVAIEIHTWSKIMIFSEVATLLIFAGSVPGLSEYFDLEFMTSGTFFWQLAVIISVSILPIWLSKVIYKRLYPPNYAKVQGY
jgi:phospholipid-translocating ATPase